MKIPEEKSLLDKVLSKLPSDKDWNENIPREAALKEQGECRYLYKANLMVERKLETKEENKLVANLDSTDKKALAAFNDKEPSSSCQVKVEFPLAVSLKEKTAILRAGKVKLEKHLSTLQDLVAEGQAASQSTVISSGEASLKSLEPFLVSLRTAVAKYDKLAADLVTKEMVEEAEALAVQAEAHFDGSKRVMAKCKAILS